MNCSVESRSKYDCEASRGVYVSARQKSSRGVIDNGIKANVEVLESISIDRGTGNWNTYCTLTGLCDDLPKIMAFHCAGANEILPHTQNVTTFN